MSINQTWNPIDDKENLLPNTNSITLPNDAAKLNIRSSSLQFCMQMKDPGSDPGVSVGFGFGSGESESVKSGSVWDYSDSEAAPASSWSTLPNRALLCRPLPMDVGRCTCIIVKEKSTKEFGAATFFSLYTNEGKGRQNRKLAVAYPKRRNGRSGFAIAQCTKNDDTFFGFVTSNLLGSRYFIWDHYQGRSLTKRAQQCKLLQAVVEFTPTVTTWTGSHRSMRTWITKHEPLQLINTSQNKHNKAPPMEWKENLDKVHMLVSRVPQYNKMTKQYELDFREKVTEGVWIQSSVKNFQLIMEGNEKQTILQLGRVAKSKYIMDFRHPLTGFQAFCICLASIDPKLCCTL